MLVSALSRALAERVTLLDITVGRKGLLSYLKSLGGSNIVKITPSSDSASPDWSGQANGHRRLKVACGANTSYLADNEWIRDGAGKGKGRTPFTFCEVRVCPHNSVVPNVGATELAEALNRVLPFTAKNRNRPVLACVLFEAREGKLRLVSADGFRLAVVSLDYEGEGKALIDRDDLKGIANALRRTKRARLSFEDGDVSKPNALTLDTELVRYKWTSVEGSFPMYEQLIPAQADTVAHFDALEALKAIGTFKALAGGKAYPIDIYLDNGSMVMANPDDKGHTAIAADIEGKPVKVRLDGGYLAQALRACGGMVDFKLTNPYSPTLFSVNGFQLVLMPMVTAEAEKQARADREAKQAEAKQAEDSEAKGSEAPSEAEPSFDTGQGEGEAKPKTRHSRKREKAAVSA
jgi:DNA polymerase-3 subunit beta